MPAPSFAEMSTRLCVRLLGAPEWHIVPFDASAGYEALEATVLAAFNADTRSVAVNGLLLCVRDDERPCLLASDSVRHLRDLDRIEVALSRRDEALPIEAPRSASPAPRPNTAQLRGLKRYPTAPPAARRLFKAQSPSRDASPALAADAAAAPAARARAPNAAAGGVKVQLKVEQPAPSDDDETAPPLLCFKVCELNGNPLLVGAKPSGVSGFVTKQLEYLAGRGVSSFISIATPHVKCVAPRCTRVCTDLRRIVAALWSRHSAAVSCASTSSPRLSRCLRREPSMTVSAVSRCRSWMGMPR